MSALAAWLMAAPVTHMVPMRDGTKLAASVYLPDGAGPWPAVLVRTPYGRKGQQHDTFAAEANRLGYVLVLQDCRGRGDSEGHHAIIFRNDGWGTRQDGYDTVEWVARQPWCNGRVGTWGGSALGITQAMMAPACPPHLVCQHITMGFSDMYSQCVYVGGAWRTEAIEVWLKRTHMSDVNLETFIDHPKYDTFWEELDPASQAAKVNVPVMFVGGWYDLFCQGTIDGFVAIQEKGAPEARGQCKLIMGPWAHGEFKELRYPDSGFPPQSDLWRWLAHHLQGERNEISAQSPVCYYVMGDPEDKNAPGNRWRNADRWPPPSSPTPYYLYKDLRLSTSAPTDEEASLTYEYDPKNPVPTVGGQNLTIPVGPMDQRKVEDRKDVLLFTTPVLGNPIEVTGRIKTKLWISSSAPDTDFTVKLCDVYPDGRSMLVTDGILRTRFRESSRTEHLLEHNHVYSIEIDLWSTSLIFNKNHRIRVAISSSNSPRFEPNPNTGVAFRADGQTAVARNSIHVDREHPSLIVLPIASRPE
jgi:uncharacterized protein